MVAMKFYCADDRFNNDIYSGIKQNRNGLKRPQNDQTITSIKRSICIKLIMHVILHNKRYSFSSEINLLNCLTQQLYAEND